MSKKCKPCDQEPVDKSYMMVEVTASSANACGDPTEESTPQDDCPLQEPTYDVTLSSFVVPIDGDDITIQVCNNTIYTVDEFVEFLGYGGLRLRITSINPDGTSMTLQNGCSNGAAIYNNPEAGEGIATGAKFIVVDTPACRTGSEATSLVQQGLAEAEEICVPLLAEPLSDTVVYHITGRTESDPSDTSIQKCIKRVKNFFFSLGAPRTPDIQTLGEVDNFSFREVACDKSSGQMKVRKLIGENTGVLAGSKYMRAGTTTSEKVIGPAFVYSPFVKLFEESGTLTNIGTYTAIADLATYSEDYSVNIAEITGLLNKDLQDHFYLYLHIIVAVDATSHASTRFLQVKINDELVMVLNGRTGTGFDTCGSITIPVKIMNVDSTFNFKLTATGDNMAYYYKIRGIGAFI